MKYIPHTLANGTRSARPQPTVIPGSLMRVMVLFVVTVCNAFNVNEVSATSIVALINRKNHTVVIATDCRVNRTLGSSSECKIIKKPGCTAAIAGLYSENTTAFDVRNLVDAACQNPGDLRAKAEVFVRLAKLPYEQAVRHIRDTNPTDFAHSVRNKATEVVFAGIQDGNVALIVRGLLADSSGKISVERFESVAPTYAHAGYFLGLNGHIRAHIKSHPDWSKEDHVQLAHRFVEMEIEAHPDLAGLPISELQINNDGYVHWIDQGACKSGELSSGLNGNSERVTFWHVLDIELSAADPHNQKALDQEKSESSLWQTVKGLLLWAPVFSNFACRATHMAHSASPQYPNSYAPFSGENPDR